MEKFAFPVIFLAVLVGAAAAPSAQEKNPPRIVFIGESEVGQVWANVSLTRQRLDQDYLPIAVMTANRKDVQVVLDRDSYRLIGPDGVRYPMPTLKELRSGYSKSAQDSRLFSAAGLPWEVWRRERKLMESNFFPDLSRNRRALVTEEVTLGPGYATLDLLYFAKPGGFAVGKPFLLEVQAIGWETPVRLGMVIDETPTK